MKRAGKTAGPFSGRVQNPASAMVRAISGSEQRNQLAAPAPPADQGNAAFSTQSGLQRPIRLCRHRIFDKVMYVVQVSPRTIIFRNSKWNS
jgi:hypothetical protein